MMPPMKVATMTMMIAAKMKYCICSSFLLRFYWTS